MRKIPKMNDLYKADAAAGLSRRAACVWLCRGVRAFERNRRRLCGVFSLFRLRRLARALFATKIEQGRESLAFRTDSKFPDQVFPALLRAMAGLSFTLTTRVRA